MVFKLGVRENHIEIFKKSGRVFQKRISQPCCYITKEEVTRAETLHSNIFSSTWFIKSNSQSFCFYLQKVFADSIITKQFACILVVSKQEPILVANTDLTQTSNEILSTTCHESQTILVMNKNVTCVIRQSKILVKHYLLWVYWECH